MQYSLEQKTCDVHTLCLYLDMTPRRVQQLVVRGVIPKGDKRGEYELMPCIHAYQTYLKRLIAHFAGHYGGKGGRAEIKERNRVERHIYRTSAVAADQQDEYNPEARKPADILSLFDSIDMRPQS